MALGPRLGTGILIPMQLPRWLVPIVLLIGSNTFMTFAWYYHVKLKSWPLIAAIGISWLIALPEYILQVPANRWGHVDHGGSFTLSQLKIIQEAITLVVFTVFTIFVAHEKPKTTDFVAFALILAAVAVSMLGRTAPAPTVP